MAACARLALLTAHPQASTLRGVALKGARAILARQLGETQRYLCKAPLRALGGFRDRPGVSHLDTHTSSECLLALLACRELLVGVKK